MTDREKREIIALYEKRLKTIRELANQYSVSYEEIRKVIRDAGYSYGLKVREQNEE